MNAAWIDPSFSLRFTTALLHFLWQGCAMGAVVVVGGFALRRAPAQWRYVLNVAALLVMAACLPATFVLLDGSAVAPSAASNPGFRPSQPVTTPTANVAIPDPADNSEVETALVVPHVETVPDVITTDHENTPSDSMPPIASCFTVLYFVGVALMLLRLAGGLRGGHRLRRSAIPIDDDTLLTTIRRQARRIGLRRVPAAAWCSQISIPVVIGVLRPLILLPPALASGLSPDQVQALMTHELAHIRRLDLLVNLLQRLIEAVLFFHPVVWFVSRRINVERENATDDVVLAAGWQAPHYADALLRMAELSSSLRTARFAPQPATLAASGQGASDFKRRVLRLLDAPETTKLHLTRGGLAALSVLILLSLTAPIAMHAVADSSESDQSTDRSEPDTSASDESKAAPTSDGSQLTRLIEQAAFGEEKHGVQMGIARSSRRQSYSMEERVPLTLIYRNVRSEPVTFKSHLDFLVAIPDVTNEDGESIPVTLFMHWEFIPPTTITLGPGEVWGIETPGLGFQGQGVWSLTDPPAGRYRLTFSAGIHSDELVPREPDPRLNLPDTTNSVLTPTWSEHLSTGELEFEVAPAADGTLQVTVAANTPPQGDQSPATDPTTEADQSPAPASIDKTLLPIVADTFSHETRILGDLVTGGGIIERIEENVIHFRSGDHIKVSEETWLVAPAAGDQPMRRLPLELRLLEPGMAIGYSMRDGKVEKLDVTGIVAQPPAEESVFDTIRELRLKPGAEYQDSLDGRFPIRVTGKDGPVLIAIGQTKLIELPEPTMLVEWQIADYRPEGVEDVEPFDYLLVQWRENGRITWTCYQSPEVAESQDAGEAAIPDVTAGARIVYALRRDLEQIQTLESAADAERDSAKRVELLHQAVEAYAEFHNQHRSQLAGLWARFHQARCLRKLGDGEEADAILEELLELPGNGEELGVLKGEIETLVQNRDAGEQRAKVRDLVTTIEAEWERAQERIETGHAYADKVTFGSDYEGWKEVIQPAPDEITAMRERLTDWYDNQEAEPALTWRIRALLARMLVDEGDREAAHRQFDAALEAYPEKDYAAPGQHSYFQHLVNQKSMLVWDDEGLDEAVEFAAELLAGDSRCHFFFAAPWRQRLESEGNPEAWSTIRAAVLEAYERRAREFPEDAAAIRAQAARLSADD